MPFYFIKPEILIPNVCCRCGLPPGENKLSISKVSGSKVFVLEIPVCDTCCLELKNREKQYYQNRRNKLIVPYVVFALIGFIGSFMYLQKELDRFASVILSLLAALFVGAICAALGMTIFDTIKNVDTNNKRDLNDPDFYEVGRILKNGEIVFDNPKYQKSFAVNPKYSQVDYWERK